MLFSSLIALSITSNGAFSLGLSNSFSNDHRCCSSVLQAKAKKTSRSPKSSGAGSATTHGFGASLTAKKLAQQTEDDFAVFPALESSVKRTLIPFEGIVQAGASDLPTDVYERLAQVYGFPKFNVLAKVGETSEDPGPCFSFQELLSSSSGIDKSDNTISELTDIRATSADSNLDILSSLSTMDSRVAITSAAPSLGAVISMLPSFEMFNVLHVDPLVISVQNFFTTEECDRYVAMSIPKTKAFDSPFQTRSKTVGKDANSASQRTSTTWFHHYKEVPELLAKASKLFGLEYIDHFEEPQTVRYRRSEKFSWHLDALAPGGEAWIKAGQRTATLLVYLTDLDENEGGATMFRDLGDAGSPLRMRPKKGSALVFFPAAGGIEGIPLDIRTLHCGEAVAEDSKHDKWIAQLWLREKPYQPTAPIGNTFLAATDAISAFCRKSF